MATREEPPFATLLQRYRVVAGLTQEELAEQAGLSVRGISDLERGARTHPRPYTVHRLTQVLALEGEERTRFEEAARAADQVAPAETGARQPAAGWASFQVPPGDEAGERGAAPDTRLGASEVRTFLLADLRGYTQFTLERGDEAAARLASRIAALCREVVTARDGAVLELRGDEALCVFASARQALRAAADLQSRLAGDEGISLGVGMGLDAGEAVPVEGGYRGTALNLAARLCQLAGAGEVLASETVSNLARKVEGLEYAERGMVQLKGFAEPVRVIEVAPAPLSLIAPGAPSGEREGVRVDRLPIGGFLGSLPAGPLVARQEELSRMLAAVEAVAGGSGRLVLLSGEPGVGKTRLAQEVTLACRNRSFVVATGSCYEARQTVPYYPFLDALATLFGTATPALRSLVPQRWPQLGRLLPEAGIPVQTGGFGSQEEQETLFRAMSGFLSALAETMPVALLLDDLHWADESSLGLLQHLARYTRSCRVLLLGTYRDSEARGRQPLERVLRDLHRDGVLERVGVERLDEEETAALMAVSFGEEEVSDEFAHLLFSHTEGNPFFTQEVLRALVERGDVFRREGMWDRREVSEIIIPESIRSTIDERLSRLSAETQEVLCEACVLGPAFRFDDLQAMSGREESRLEGVLDEASAAGVVRPRDPDEYAFNHALTQHALYAELSPRRRRKLHLAVGEALERLGVEKRRAAELSRHFQAGGDAERALRYALPAGDQAEELLAHAEAEQHFRTALALTRKVGDREREAEALEKLGQVLAFTGRLDAALEMLGEAEQRYGQLGDQEAQARVVARVAYAHRTRGTAQEGIEHVRRTLDMIDEEATPRGAALLYVALAHLSFVSGRHEETLEVSERAAELARLLGDDHILTDAEWRRGTALNNLGREDEGIPVLEQAVRLAEAGGNLYALGGALNNLGAILASKGELVAAHGYTRGALEVGRRRGLPMQVMFITSQVAESSFKLGDWATARRIADEGLALVRTLQVSWQSSYALMNAGQIHLHSGVREEAARLLGEALAIAERNQDRHAIEAVQQVMAEGDLLQGDPEAARDRLLPLFDRPSEDHKLTSELLVTLAEARLELNDNVGASDLLARTTEFARVHSFRLRLAEALRVQGMLETREARWEDARRAFDEALSLTRSMPCPYLEARTLYEYGKLDAQGGEPQQARQKLEEALAIFQRLGALPYLDRTERALAQLAPV